MIKQSLILVTLLVSTHFVNASIIVDPQMLSDGRTVDLQGLEWLDYHGDSQTRDQVEATVLDSVSGGGWAYASVDQTTRLMASLLGDGSKTDKIVGAEWFIEAFEQTDDWIGPASAFRYGNSNECGVNVSCVSGVSLYVSSYDPYVVSDASICYIFGEGCGGPYLGEGPVPDDIENGAGHLLVRLTVNHVNELPTANAGNDQIVNEGVIVNLNGSLSSDSDSTIDSYSWTQTAGTAVVLSDAGTATPSFTAPAVISDAVLMFLLEVTDNDGDTDTASVTIKVTNALVVDAGTDQQITEGDIVQLNGLNSLGVSDMYVNYMWTQTEGPTVILDDSSSATPSFIAPAVDATTLLVFKLFVSDSNGLQDYDTTFVNVRDELSTAIAPPLDVQLIDTVVSGNTLYQFDTMSDPFFASTN